MLMLSVRGKFPNTNPPCAPLLFKMDGKTKQRQGRGKASRKSPAIALSVRDRGTEKLSMDLKTTYHHDNCVYRVCFSSGMLILMSEAACPE